MSLFLSDDIAARAKAAGRSVFDQIKAEHSMRQRAMRSNRANEPKAEEVAPAPEQPNPEENAKKDAWRASWRRMIDMASRPKRDFLFVATESLTFEKLTKIVSETCRSTGITEADIKSHRRGSMHVVKARQCIYWRACSETKLSLPDIGRELNKHHTTVLIGSRRFQEALLNGKPWAVMLAGDAR